MVCGAAAYHGAPQGAEFDGFGARGLAALGKSKADAAFGLMLGPAGACDAGDGDGEGDACVAQGAGGHLNRNRLGHRAIGGKGLGRNPCDNSTSLVATPPAATNSCPPRPDCGPDQNTKAKTS